MNDDDGDERLYVHSIISYPNFFFPSGCLGVWLGVLMFHCGIRWILVVRETRSSTTYLSLLYVYTFKKILAFQTLIVDALSPAFLEW